MAQYSPEIIHAATERLEQRRTQHEEEYARRRQEVYRRAPRVQAIDRQLRATVTRAAAAAFRSGGDAKAAIAALHDQHDALKRERGELLRSMGYGEDALNQQPLCPLCGDRGWRGATMCQCLKTLCQEEEVRQKTSLMNLRGQSFDDFRREYYPPQYRARMEIVFQFCLSYAQNFPDCDVRNLLFSGEPGLGKTFLSVCIAREVGSQGRSVVYDSAIHIFDRMEAAKFTADPEAKEEMARYLSCDLLVLDDLGSEMTVPSVQSALYHIVNTRLLEERHTIISTNLKLGELQHRYSPQVCSRLEGEYKIFTFAGEDIRKKVSNLNYV
jgi:DNA replication protein DnaC